MAKIVEICKTESLETGKPIVTAVIYQSGYARYYVNRTDKIPQKVFDFVAHCSYANRIDNVVIYHE